MLWAKPFMQRRKRPLGIKLITVQKSDAGPVVYMWVDGKEVGHVELNTRATANLISDLAKSLVEKTDA